MGETTSGSNFIKYTTARYGGTGAGFFCYNRGISWRTRPTGTEVRGRVSFVPGDFICTRPTGAEVQGRVSFVGGIG